MRRWFAENFPLTAAGLRRMRRAYRIWWAGYHVFAAMDYLHKLGDEGDEAFQALKTSYICHFPPARAQAREAQR